MLLNRVQQVRRSPIVQEKESLPHAPQRSGPELIGTGDALRNTVGQIVSHVVQGEVGIGMVGHVGHPCEDRFRGRERRGMTERAADAREER